MATRTRDIFTTIHTEGAILPPDLLQRIAEGGDGLEGLRSEDYHRPGEKLNEVINRAWNVLLAAWQNFEDARERLPEDDIGTTITRERWLLPLFRELDYGRLPTERAVEIDGKSYPVSHRDAEGNVPIHLLTYQADLDHRNPGIAGAATTSPHSMVQVYLNRSDDHLWGFLSNGLRLRILRDNVSLTRQAYVEFDLEAMMNGEVYADFVLLWLLCHSSRVEGERPEQFWLERWMQTAIEQGTRALDQLRDNVEHAITALGAGFLSHPHNMALRDRLQDGALDPQDYYRQLLRLVYRLLFLFVAEDRDLLLDPDAGEAARARYTEFYSTRRLRDVAERFRGTRHHDLYHGLRLVMQLLGAERNGEGRALGLPVLGSFLFSDDAVRDVIGCEIANRDLLDAIRALAFTQDQAVRRLRAVDYKNLGPEELGSVYESLLELHPQINVPARTFALSTASGHERKTTGSYYTPSSLIQALLDSALDPVLDEARTRGETAILDLKICDPACGSGHFLIAASHRIAKALAAVRTLEDEPAPDAIRAALRDVIGHSIYGVDINPMAVELCKVGLWMEALEPGKPLSFLDHRIQCGNSLLGTTPALMARGIPEDAFPTKSGLIEGDQNKIVSALRKRNRDERKARDTGQRSMFEIIDPPADYSTLAAELDALDAIEDATLAGVRAKEQRYRDLGNDPDYIAARFLADAWCAAFVWRKAEAATFGDDDRPVPPPITDLTYRLMEEHPHDDRWRDLRPYVAYLRERYQFFHWHVAFPDVFDVPDRVDTESVTGWHGGFDCVLGNPPWERIQIEEKQFFASTRPDIASARSRDRKKLIASLAKEDHALYRLWKDAERVSIGQSHFVKGSGLFPLAGSGNVNTFALFPELAANCVDAFGRVGMIVPSSIVTEVSNQALVRDWMEHRRLAQTLDFENKHGIFPDVHSSFRFCLLTVGGQARYEADIDFAFMLHETGDLGAQSRRLSLSLDDIQTINPNTLTVPPITYRYDADILLNIQNRFPVLVNESTETYSWPIESKQMLNTTHDSEYFVEPDQTIISRMDKWGVSVFEGGPLLRIYDGKMVDQYNHRLASVTYRQEATYRTSGSEATTSDQCLDPKYLVLPQYWVRETTVRQRQPEYFQTREWMLAVRTITASTNWRTVIAAVIPDSGMMHSFSVVYLDIAVRKQTAFLAMLNCYPFDYVTRLKMSGTNLTKSLLNQLPVLPPKAYTPPLLDFIVPRVLELTYTAWDLQSFAQDVGYDGPPFVWDEERRFLMRCELDALYFHLYGIARDDMDYIMETFPIVKRKDIAATATEDSEGEYRTKHTILAMYDEMAALGVHDDPDRIAAFDTWLSPEPASPAVAHPPR